MKIFAHRGLVTKNAKENSFESLEEAYKNKFFGIEFDIWFFDNQLYIKHDLPKKEEFESLPKFADFFIHGNKFEYWIDFKNLNENNVVEVCKIMNQAFVDNEINLKQVYFVPFINDLEKALPIYNKIKEIFFEAQIVALCYEIKDFDLLSYRKNLIENDIKFLSIQHELVNENFTKVLHDISLFAWTVNDLKRLQDLELLGVKAIATDVILE